MNSIIGNKRAKRGNDVPKMLSKEDIAKMSMEEATRTILTLQDQLVEALATGAGKKSSNRVNTLVTQLEDFKKMIRNLDDGEAIDCLYGVILTECFDALRYPESMRKQYTSLRDFDEHIRFSPNGETKFRKLPKAVKECGGPACVQIILDIQKRARNKTAHFNIPKDVEVAIKRINKKFKASQVEVMPSSLRKYIEMLAPKLKIAIDTKNAKQIAEDQMWLGQRVLDLKKAKQEMETFLRDSQRYRNRSSANS